MSADASAACPGGDDHWVPRDETGAPLQFSGIYHRSDDAESRAWLRFTDHEYYHRCRAIMLGYGMGEGDVESTLANVWETGWIAGSRKPGSL